MQHWKIFSDQELVVFSQVLKAFRRKVLVGGMRASAPTFKPQFLDCISPIFKPTLRGGKKVGNLSCVKCYLSVAEHSDIAITSSTRTHHRGHVLDNATLALVQSTEIYRLLGEKFTATLIFSCHVRPSFLHR